MAQFHFDCPDLTEMFLGAIMLLSAAFCLVIIASLFPLNVLLLFVSFVFIILICFLSLLFLYLGIQTFKDSIYW
jgi:hypothetical protein